MLPVHHTNEPSVEKRRRTGDGQGADSKGAKGESAEETQRADVGSAVVRAAAAHAVAGVPGLDDVGLGRLGEVERCVGGDRERERGREGER